MIILVTGATGFIGNYVIRELLKNTQNKIVATSRNIEKAKKCSWYDKIRYIQYDLNSNSIENLYSFFEEPDLMIHLAWEGLPEYTSLVHIERNLSTNYKVIKNLIHNGLKNIAISGTCLEYGMVNGSLSEELITNPVNSYAIAKDTLRKYIEELSKNYDFSYQWIRLFYMYGKGQSKKSLLSLLDTAIANGKQEFNMSKGEQLRDYLHVSDVAKYIVCIATSKINNQVINCCSGKPISIRTLVEKYLDEMNYEVTLNLGYYPYPSHESMAFWGNNAKLNKLLEGSK